MHRQARQALLDCPDGNDVVGRRIAMADVHHAQGEIDVEDLNKEEVILVTAQQQMFSRAQKWSSDIEEQKIQLNRKCRKIDSSVKSSNRHYK